MAGQQGRAIDWHAVHQSREFQLLAARRGRFVRLATTAILSWFALFLVVVGAAPAFAGTVVVAGMTVGFLFGLAQFVLAWFITWRYLRLSATVFSPLEEAVVAVAVGGAPRDAKVTVNGADQ